MMLLTKNVIFSWLLHSRRRAQLMPAGRRPFQIRLCHSGAPASDGRGLAWRLAGCAETVRHCLPGAPAAEAGDKHARQRRVAYASLASRPQCMAIATRQEPHLAPKLSHRARGRKNEAPALVSRNAEGRVARCADGTSFQPQLQHAVHGFEEYGRAHFR